MSDYRQAVGNPLNPKCSACDQPRHIYQRGGMALVLCYSCDMLDHWSAATMTPDMMRRRIPIGMCNCAGCERLRGMR